MPASRLIYSLTRRNLPASSGNKALNLHRLQRLNRKIPKTYVCTWDSYQRYINNDHSLVDDLKAELGKVIQPQMAYAVRSSANIEDSQERSFAGQFKTAVVFLPGFHLLCDRDAIDEIVESQLARHLGHNRVSQKDRSSLLEGLDRKILPGILKAHASDCISLCTPLAPGSDMILAEAMHERLAASGIAHRATRFQVAVASANAVLMPVRKPPSRGNCDRARNSAGSTLISLQTPARSGNGQSREK